MFNFKITRHDDIHGDAICFSVVDEDGHSYGRYPSEIEAIEQLPYLEALAEDEKRYPRHTEAWTVLYAAE